jgi:hypothetical protein
VNRIIVPPGGFAGFSQMTQASQRALGSAVSRGNGTRKKRTARKAARSGSAKRKRRSAAGKAARLVKGSAAAKRYMAKIRRMRKK